MELEYLWVEACMRQFLGEKASYIASTLKDPKELEVYLIKCLDKCEALTLGLDTTIRHKEMIIHEMNSIRDRVRDICNSSELTQLTIQFLWWVSRMYGLDYVSGLVKNTPMYYQDFRAHLESIRENQPEGEPLMRLYDLAESQRLNVITKRKQLYQQLKSEGYSDQDIAKIFDTSVYAIQKIKLSL